MVATLHAESSGQLVIAGGVRRPDLWKIRPDVGFFTSLPRIVGLMAGGDDSVLTQRGALLRAEGPDRARRARGGARSAGRRRADRQPGAVRAGPRRCRAGLCGTCQRLGPLDAGQAVVVARGEVLAIEGAEGTDAMLQRVAGLRRSRSARSARWRADQGAQARPGAARRHAGDRPAHRCGGRRRRSGGHRGRAGGGAGARQGGCGARRRRGGTGGGGPVGRGSAAGARPGAAALRAGDRPPAAEPPRCRRHREGARCRDRPCAVSDRARRRWWRAPTSWRCRRPRASASHAAAGRSAAAVGRARASIASACWCAASRRRRMPAAVERLLAEAAGRAWPAWPSPARTGRSRPTSSAARAADAHGLFLVVVRGAVRGVSVTGVGRA